MVVQEQVKGVLGVGECRCHNPSALQHDPNGETHTTDNTLWPKIDHWLSELLPMRTDAIVLSAFVCTCASTRALFK